FETIHGHFVEGERVIHLDADGHKHFGNIGEVLTDGDADFIGDDHANNGTYKWRTFRKIKVSLDLKEITEEEFLKNLDDLLKNLKEPLAIRYPDGNDLVVLPIDQYPLLSQHRNKKD